MNITNRLKELWKGDSSPFLIYDGKGITVEQIFSSETARLQEIREGDCVALVGDFEPSSILSLFSLIEKNCIVVPLSQDTKNDHEYFFETAQVDWVIENGNVIKREVETEEHPYLKKIREERDAGLILFSTGTTGRPKAIVHKMSTFLDRFKTPRPSYITLNFLMFDHIGGINTLFHALYNKALVVCPKTRTVDDILETLTEYQIELLPTSPTFLRMLLFSGAVPDKISKSLKVITYGTERMDQSTLSTLAKLLPGVDFRQTYGMSELGIFRIKSQARDSLWFKIGGEGIETKVQDDVLFIRSQNRMLGYLNSQDPFDEEGWYNTKDLVEVDEDWIRIVGRTSDVISVGGIKFLPSEVERAVLEHENVKEVKVYGRDNPITGQHVEMIVELKDMSENSKKEFKKYCNHKLASAMVPHRIIFDQIDFNHRFKRI